MSEVKVNKISPRTNCGTTTLGDAGDTITVTGDLKSNSLKSASGSTITLGQSGDTIQLGCGASQTGFGRTGTVDWDTTAKTASFTAVSGNGYFVNTTSGAITLTLPSSPSAGDIVSVADYANTFNTNNLTIARNSSNIEGDASDFTANIQGVSLTLVYVDATKGWIITNTGNSSDAFLSPFIIATGGTITTCGNCKIHTFTGPGTFTVCNVAGVCGPTRNQVSYMVVAGGGGSGSSQDGHQAGGGGAGGFRENKSPLTPYTASPLEGAGAITVTATAFPITVGSGGSSGPTITRGGSGSNSIFSTITSAGGGGGGAGSNPGTDRNGLSGGSGGGSASSDQSPQAGGTGNTPPVSPSQGNPGGPGIQGPGAGGSGGGATAAGTQNPNIGPGPINPGGAGATTNITASPVTYSTGGGNNPAPPSPATAGADNTGDGSTGGTITAGANGGSGIVVIRYKYQ